MKNVKINDVTIAYERLGNGTPLLLVHGFPLDHTSWNESASLLENDFDLILPDLRGFGQSTTIESPYSISDMADDLAGLLDHLEIKKTIIAGHSMGGYVALAFAKKYPERVSGFGLISSQAVADAPEGRERRYKTAQEVAEKGVGVVVEAMTPKFSADLHIQGLARSVMEQQSKSAIIGALKAMAEREDVMEHLPVNVPVVLIHGDADALIPPERAKEINAALSDSKMVILPGAGHLPMMEFAKETAEALKLLK